MTDIFIKILNMSITATYVALVIMLVRMLLNKAPKIFSYSLWSVLLFRLISPFNFTSSLSLLRPLNNDANYVPQNIGLMESPSINTNLENIDMVVNNSLPAATPYASVNPMQILMSLVTLIWLLGIAALLIYSIFSYIKVYRKIQFATLVEGNIYETDQIITPFVFGFIKPRIYLPANLKSGEREYIISHEKTHIKRSDYLIKPISFLILAIHWFNPLMWISYYLMLKDMEMSCDESVMKNSIEDLRGNYSSSLLSLSAKQSGLIMPLAFGESNIRSRIKNILNYKKPSFWTILIAVLVVIVISIGLMTNPLNNTAKGKAEEFLKLYYTIENTDIADMFYDESLMDDSKLNFDGTGITSIKGLDEALSAKYGSLMTEDAFNRASANRTLLIGEVTAREYGTRITIEGVNLWDEEVSENGDVTYQFSIPARVKFKDGTEELINLNGTIVMKKLDNDWKVSDFQINRTELVKVLEHGKSILSITNQSHAPISRIEVDTEGNSQGAMNADNTIMEMNSRFDFEMIDAKNIFFNVKLLNVDNEILFEQAFSGDFSKGKDVYLYIVNYGDDELMIIEGSTDGIPNTVLASEFFDKLVKINDKTYVDTGYEVPNNISRSDIIGKISSAVKSHETPTDNEQANFEIKGANIAKYNDDIVVSMDNKWILFKNQDDMPSGFSVNNFGFLMEEYSDEEIFGVFRTIRQYIIVDENYRDNLTSIIEKSFKENGIDDPDIIEKAKRELQIEVKYSQQR